jgi:hypothetical protein
MTGLGLAFALAAVADWTPARWNSSDPKSLEFVRRTPVNCLLIEERNWSAEFNRAAAESGIATLAVLREGVLNASRLKELGFAGAALEGEVEGDAPGLTIVRLGLRTSMRFATGAPVVGTSQGVWPGINQTEEEIKAAPSGAPWIDTNSGFLRFVRAAAGDSAVWIAHRPPEKAVIPVSRYIQAIADSAVVGAHWVVALDADFDRRLLSREAKALADWQRIGQAMKFFDEHKNWLRLPPYGQLAVVQDIASGGLITGGILDMIAVKHTPVRAVVARDLSPDRMKGARMAVNVDPAQTGDSGKEILRDFTRGGGTLLTAPPGWKFPPQRPGQIKLDDKEVEKIDTIWKEVNSMTGRNNLGARLFNVASLLSSLAAPPSGKPLVLWLVNYSDFDVENVTAHVLGKFAKATLYEPGAAPRKMEVYEAEDGTGVDIEKVHALAALVLE